MTRPSRVFAGMVTVTAVVSSCGTVIAGSPTWPGATLEEVVLTAEDFPEGVQYDRITFEPGQADGAAGPPAMLSRPPGCSDGLTNVIAKSAERGPGSAVQYSATYDGARMVMTVLSWHLDLDSLAQTAQRCATFETFFDAASPGIPMTTTQLSWEVPAAADALVYEQTMDLGATRSTMSMAFANIGPMAMFGLSLPAPNPGVSAKASLPQTFLEVVARQSTRIAAA